MGVLLLLKKLPWKWLGPVLGALALVISIYFVVNTVRGWMDDIYQNGYTAGVAKAQADCERARAASAEDAMSRLAEQVQQSNAAVEDYVRELAEREPQVITVTKEIERYAEDPAGGIVCLDADGVRLLRDAHSAASNQGSNPEASTDAR